MTSDSRGITGLVLLTILAALLASGAGAAAILGVAALTASPALFLLAGLLTFCLVFALLVLLVTRRRPRGDRRRLRLLLFAAGAAVVVVLFAVTALRPLDDPRLPPDPVAGLRYWELPTGSRIAYVRLPAQAPVRETPVIFLHGGPGVPDMKGDAEYFGSLTRDGLDVYVYDQIGRGRSARLQDPAEYTLARDVADLEAIRRRIGSQKVVLIGHSAGGVLAAAYAARHPGNVARMVLASPGDPDPAAAAGDVTARLSLEEKLRVYALLVTPRPLLAYALLQVAPEAAHAFAGDAELDARFDRIYNRQRAALHCRGKPQGRELHGLGFYAHYYRQSATSPSHADFLPALAEADPPTLIFKGGCDYLSWSSATTYGKALPHAQLVYLPDAGHNVYADEPARFMAAVRAFLLERPVPDATSALRKVPEGYQGPG